MHAFNPNPRKEYKMGGDSSQTQSHSEIPGWPFQTEVEVRDSGWLFGFSDLQVEPQCLSLGFYLSCCILQIENFMQHWFAFV